MKEIDLDKKRYSDGKMPRFQYYYRKAQMGGGTETPLQVFVYP